MKKRYLATLAAILLAGCTAKSNLDPEQPEKASENKPVETRIPAAAGVTVESLGRVPLTMAEDYTGTGQFARGADQTSENADTNFQVTLEFDEAPLDEVVKVILGSTLRVPYVIDDAVEGEVTLSTADAIGAEAALATLETILRMNDAALIIQDGVYQVVPIEMASHATLRPQLGAIGSDLPRGHSLRVVPLRHMGAEQMAELMRPFLPEGTPIQADPARNLLIVAGSSSEVANLIETTAVFDVDWLAGMSVGLYPLQNVDPQQMISELTALFQSQMGGPLQDIIRFMPIERLKAVMVMTHQSAYLRSAKRWIERLDRGLAVDPQLYVHPLDYATAGEIAPLLAAAFTANVPSEGSNELAVGDDQIRIIPDEVNNALLIKATPDEYRKIKAALHKMDVAPVQVMIEATIAEVRLTDDLRYGLQWFFEAGDWGEAILSTAADGAVASTFPGFSFVAVKDQSIRVVLDALDEVTAVDVISSPMLMVLDNQEAELNVGQQVPVATQQQQQTSSPDAPIVNSIEFRDTGIILNVKPQVNAGGALTLQIDQEVSGVAPTAGAGTLTPTITQRRISSSVLVHDGETVVLGGLISDQMQSGRAGVPLLSDIPVAGALFSTTTDKTEKTELIVMITPRVVTNRDEARAVTKELRSRLLSESDFGRIKRSETTHPLDGSY